jgi:hypothetical protein
LSAIRRGPDGSLTYIDRRVDGQDRLQIEPPRSDQISVAPRGTCGVESFVADGVTYFAAAAGCEQVINVTDVSQASWVIAFGASLQRPGHHMFDFHKQVASLGFMICCHLIQSTSWL